MNVLFLSAWYPNRYDSMAGLFVQKHAEAVSLYADVKVLYIHADENIKDYGIEVTKFNKIEEYRIYYPYVKLPYISKISKATGFLSAYRKGFRLLKNQDWHPDIIHTNVLTRTPLISYIYKIKHHTPYVITEHWTRYLKSRNEYYSGFIRKTATKLIIKNASCIMPVSAELKEGLEFNNLLLTRTETVPNVVDNCFYKSFPGKFRTKKTILNVTCFTESHKNLFGLLRVIKKISAERDDFELILVGTGNDFQITVDYCNSLGLTDENVKFAGLKTSEEVAEMMQNSDFIVQFSNYESAGVVVQEALVSGKPVISTRVGIAPDYINSSNGLLVDVKDENQLMESINYMLDNLNKYNSDEIRKNASGIFSYEHIGKEIVTIYNEIISVRKTAHNH